MLQITIFCHNKLKVFTPCGCSSITFTWCCHSHTKRVQNQFCVATLLQPQWYSVNYSIWHKKIAAAAALCEQPSSKCVVFLLTAYEVWKKVMFLHLSVIMFTGAALLARQTMPGKQTPPRKIEPLKEGRPSPGRQTPQEGRHPPAGRQRAPSPKWLLPRSVRTRLECILV